MHEAFFSYLKRYSSETLTEDERVLIRQVFIPFKLRKRQYFLQAGDVCKNFAFIVKGAMRQYVVDDKGAEHVGRLGIENWWMGDRESFLIGTPSIYHIDAWENTEMLLISKAGTDELTRSVPAFCEMTREMDHRNNIANQRRITSSISSAAEKRYAEFVECYPDLMERFPQHVIASYLGITKDTLSRVKRHLLRK